MGSMTGKVAVVAGGARGIGAECARLLAREGAKVILTDPEERPALRVTDEILSLGGSAMFMRQDPCDEASWPRVFELASKLFGRTGIFVNTVAEGCALTATEAGTRHALAAMRGGKDAGSIVHLAPDGEELRDALRTLIRTTAQQCRDGGAPIRVNTVVPAPGTAPDAGDLARAVLWLLSEDARSISGSEWVVPPPA
jgi:hypothetical protein